jgi:hypothetical protein
MIQADERKNTTELDDDRFESPEAGSALYYMIDETKVWLTVRTTRLDWESKYHVSVCTNRSSTF